MLCTRLRSIRVADPGAGAHARRAVAGGVGRTHRGAQPRGRGPDREPGQRADHTADVRDRQGAVRLRWGEPAVPGQEHDQELDDHVVDHQTEEEGAEEADRVEPQRRRLAADGGGGGAQGAVDVGLVEQIAGDLLPNRTDDQLVATGFQRCNITTNEGGTIVEENLANYAADRVQTMGWVYLGLTTNCAQCHGSDGGGANAYCHLAAMLAARAMAPCNATALRK